LLQLGADSQDVPFEDLVASGHREGVVYPGSPLAQAVFELSLVHGLLNGLGHDLVQPGETGQDQAQHEHRQKTAGQGAVAVELALFFCNHDSSLT
jgi:hypothetical protein